jgi:hypothetical protein
MTHGVDFRKTRS